MQDSRKNVSRQIYLAVALAKSKLDPLPSAERLLHVVELFEPLH